MMHETILVALGASALIGSFLWTVYWLIDVLWLKRVYLDVHNTDTGEDWHGKARTKDGGVWWKKGLDKPVFITLHHAFATAYRGRPKYRVVVPNGLAYKPEVAEEAVKNRFIDGRFLARLAKSQAAQKVAYSSGDDSQKWRAMIWVGGILAIGVVTLVFLFLNFIQGGGVSGAA